jgi:ribosomal protein S11
MLKESTTNKFKYRRTLRIKNLFKNNKYFLNKKVNLIFDRENINYVINIKVTPNNIFCNLTTNNQKKTIILLSGGILKLNISKKKLKFASKYVLQKFLKNLRNLQKTFILINIKGPIKIKKNILKQLLHSLKGYKILIDINSNKCFNGCRPKKIKRKKRKGFRILK